MGDRAAKHDPMPPYDAFLDEEVAQRQQRTRGLFEIASKSNPDRVAEAARLSKSTGLPADLVERNLDEVRRRQQARALDLQRMALDSPVLARQLADPSFTRVAHDDISTLATIERFFGMRTAAPITSDNTLKAWSGPAPTFSAITRGLAASVSQGFDAARQGARMQISDLLDGLGIAPRNDAERANDIRRSAQTTGANAYTTPAFESDTAAAVYGGVSSTLQQLPGLALSVATRNPAPALASAGLTTQAQAYAKYRGRGADPGLAFAAATGEGTVEVGTELLPMGFLASALGRTGVKEFVVGLLARELPTEQVATLLQDAIDTATANPDKTWADFAAERPGAAYSTLISTLTQAGLVGGASAAVGRLNRDSQRAADATTDAQVLDLLAAAAGESKLAKRDPERFAEHVNNAAAETPVKELFVDANTFAQSMPPDRLASLPASITDQLDEAMATGGDIAISIGDWTAHLADVPELVQHMRTDPDAMSAAEAASYSTDDALQAELDDLAPPAESAPTNATGDAVAQARQTIIDSLTAANRFTPAVNAQYADLIGAFISTTAERAGLDVDRVSALVPRIVSQLSTPGGFLEQAVFHGSPHDFDAFSLDKLGTGEGAQAYGHGLYFAENRGVAAGYFTALADNPGMKEMKLGSLRMNDRTGFDYSRRASESDIENIRASLAEDLMINENELHAVGKEGFRQYVLDTLDAKIENYSQEDNRPEYVHAARTLRTMLAAPGALSIAFHPVQGGVYNVDIPDEAIGRMLLWDKPLSEQPEAVRKALEPLGFRVEEQGGATVNPTGEQIYHEVVQRQRRHALDQVNAQFDALLASGKTSDSPEVRALVAEHDRIADAPQDDSPEAASEALAAAGIPGIRYLDGGSRDGGTGTHNVVVFDQAVIDQMNATVGKALYQDRRGAFDPSTKTIALLQHADLSTFIHEAGHFFLDASVEVASQPDAPAGVQADVQALLDWFGVADIATWRGMTLDQQREHHEQFARGFEQYAMDGKAPSVELATAFARFRSWLLSVYRKLTSLNVELTPEVRAVMDRMLATDAQIADAQAQRALQPLFTSAEQAGMTPVEFAAYQATGEQATQTAVASLQARTLRDMQAISASKDRAARRITADARTKRKTIEAEVTAEVFGTPIYAAWRDLARGKTADGHAVRLSLADLRENFPALVDRIPHGMAADTAHAIPAEMLAEAYGLTSGDELVKLLATVDKPADVIEGRTDQLMLERHGDLADPRAVERAANEAVANDARLRVLEREVNTLGKAVGNRPVLARAARAFAEQSVARKKVRELRPGQHTAAEARAGREAMQAFKKGDTAAAAMAKRTQMLQHVLGRTTIAAQIEVEKAIDYLRKFDNDATRKAIGPDYAEQIDALLERVDLRTGVSLKAIDKRKSLADWVKSQEEIGFSPVIDERLLADAGRRSFKDMTVEEVRGIVDTVKNIDHLGRLKQRLLTAKDQRTFDETVTTVSDSIVKNGGKRKPLPIEAEKGLKPWLAGMWAAHRKIGSLAHQMDGGRDNGAVYAALVRPMNDASTAEQVMVEKATVELARLYEPILALKGGTDGAKVFIPEIGASLSRGARLSVALNVGNTGNLQRLLDGDHWTTAQAHAVVRTLSPVELEFVNQVHEYIDGYWPAIKAQQLRVSGVSEDKVPASPWQAIASDGSTVQMRGGYYPAKYDIDRSATAEQHDAAQVAKDMLQGAYVRATTRRGHTKARADEVKDRPLRKDLGVITQHITEVTHNLAWQEWLIDANRLLGSKAIDSAIREHYGPPIVRTLKDDFAGIATADVVSGTAIDQALLKLRSNVSRSTMGLSFTTALLQPFGLTQSVARIGAKPVLRGLARWGGDAARLESSMSWISEKSDFMRLRAKTFNRELTEIAGRVGGKSKAMQAVDSALFFMTTKMQMVADVPTWIGRYEQALAQGLDESLAIAQADEAVLASQGGGQIKDLAEVQRKHPFLTQFYSYFSTTLNLTIDKTASTDFKNPTAVAGWLADMALLSVVPAIAPAVLTELLRGGGDDPEDWLKKLAQWQASYLMGMVVGVRELSGIVSGYSYSGPPVSRVVTDTGKLAQQVQQGEVDEPAVMAVIRLMGSALGIPTTQAIRSYKGWVAWTEGDAPASSILFGPPPKD